MQGVQNSIFNWYPIFGVVFMAGLLPCLDDLATAALERETLTREELDEIFDAHELRHPALAYVDQALLELSDQSDEDEL